MADADATVAASRQRLRGKYGEDLATCCGPGLLVPTLTLQGADIAISRWQLFTNHHQGSARPEYDDERNIPSQFFFPAEGYVNENNRKICTNQ